MSEPIARNEIFDYDETHPFQLHKVYYPREVDENLLLNHWHKEIEITYSFQGHTIHYIDGKKIVSDPGKLIIVNSESIHSVVQDYSCNENDDLFGMVFIFSYDFVKGFIPDLEQSYFVYSDQPCKEELKQVIDMFAAYIGSPFEKEDNGLYIKGLISMLFFFIQRDYARPKEECFPLNEQKNMERMRGVLNYIQLHYSEHISLKEVAARFYFSSGYFSRFFKKNTNYTFSSYVSLYRLIQAKKKIETTEKSVMEIALECGFSDSRGLINEFKKHYGITPKQYRLQKNK